jgi:ribonuclease HI
LKTDAVVYTDGSCSYRNGSGGWAYVVILDEGIIECSDAEHDTTIGRMELMAATMALDFLVWEGVRGKVLLVSDSLYVVEGFNDKRRARNKHKDLWDLMEELAPNFEAVLFEHIKGHKGDFWNERADFLAGTARKSIL